MQTIIDLWNGNITPSERCASHDPEANHLVRLMEKNRENLREGLTAAQAEVLQKYIDCSEEYLRKMMELAFYDGFRIGGKLTVEIML